MKKAIKKDKKFIRDGFDGIAAKYDFFNNFITFGQHRRIVAKAIFDAHTIFEILYIVIFKFGLKFS